MKASSPREGIEVDNFDLGLESPPLEEDSIDFGIAEEGTTDGNPIDNLDLGIDTSDLESPSNEGSIDLGTVGDDTVSEGGVEVDNLDLGIEIPSMESSPDEGSIDFVVSELESAPPPSGNSPQGNPLDLDDLLTLDEGENLVVEQPPMDDNSFDPGQPGRPAKRAGKTRKAQGEYSMTWMTSAI
jgi:hypothetical protein